MQPSDYWAVFRKRWPLILCALVAAVVASYLFTRFQTRLYRANAVLTASPSRFDYSLNLVMEDFLRQFTRELQTDRQAELVNNRLNLDLAPERLLGKVKASAVLDDMTLLIEVDDTDPTRARDIAFAWADEYIKFNTDKMATRNPTERIDIALLDRPRPAVLNWPKTQQIVMAAALLGLLAGAMLAFLLEYLDDTLKTSEDVDRYLGAPMLAAIPALDGVVGRAGSSNGHRGAGKAPTVTRVG